MPLQRHTRKLVNRAASTALVLAGLSTLWMMGSPQQSVDPGADSVPAVGALVRSGVTGPIEFDATFKNRSSGLCLDLERFLIDNNYPVQAWGCSHTDNQRLWADAVVGSDVYRLRFEHSGKCLEAVSVEDDNAATASTELRQWVCHQGSFEREGVAADAQHWRLNDLGNNRFSVVSVSTGLAISSGGAERGSLFALEEIADSDEQRFELLQRNDHETHPAVVGRWGELIAWPHVPIHAAITPDNTVVTWASNELNNYPQATGNKFSWSSVYDPSTNSFLQTNNLSHDMFCAGTTLLEDGSLLASGGNPQASESSRFDPLSNSWSLSAYMSHQRWYGTNVVTGSGDVFSTFAKGAQEVPELFSVEAQAWRELPGADMSLLRDEQDLGNSLRVNGSAELQWYAFMHTAPDGRVFQSGPTKTMHWYSVDGQGAVEPAGTRSDSDPSRQFGSAVMYDVGKLMLSGGSDPTIADQLSVDGRDRKLGASNTAMTIDISGASPVVQALPPMNSRRANHNAVVLPNGEVYVVGGTEWGLLFDDHYSAWWPEIWNPKTRQWRDVAALSTPRNYHSWALLLQDGRVLTGGGGLCGDCSANHPDAQIYSPPYLFASNGVPAVRPEIVQGTRIAKPGGLLSFSTDTEVASFNLVRMSSVTHSINTDQRFIPLHTESLGGNAYISRLDSNVNVLVPGMYWVFAINAAGTPSEGHLLQVKSVQGSDSSLIADTLPDGTLVAAVGKSVELQLDTDGFDSSTLVATAINLPSGLNLESDTGLISGQALSEASGSFIVSLSDGQQQMTERVDYRFQDDRGRVTGGGSASYPGLGLLWALLLWVTRRRITAL